MYKVANAIGPSNPNCSNASNAAAPIDLQRCQNPTEVQARKARMPRKNNPARDRRGAWSPGSGLLLVRNNDSSRKESAAKRLKA